MQRLLEPKYPPVDTGLVYRHLLEAGHQLGCVVQRAHQNSRALLIALYKFFKLAAGQPL